MTNSTQKKNATAPIMSDATPFDLAFGNALNAQDESERVNMTFMETLDALRAMGVDEQSLKGNHGKTKEGKYFDPARRVIARNMEFTPEEFAVLFDTDDRLRDKDNKFTPRGTLNNRVTKRLSTLRDRIVKEDAKTLKAATAGKSGVSTGGAKPEKNNGPQTLLKGSLDNAAKLAKLLGEAKTTAQTDAKASWVDVAKVHAWTVEYHDNVRSVTGKNGYGKN